MPRTWEVLAEFVEAACKDAVGGVKCLFDAVSVMTVDVDIQNAGEISSKMLEAV